MGKMNTTTTENFTNLFNPKTNTWTYNGGCIYLCEYHRGKVEWHHPIDAKPSIGLYLCECHHSIICGRNKKYPGEIVINKTINEMRTELKNLEWNMVVRQGGDPAEIDKH